MEENVNVFPLDITEREPGARPWKFRPDGYLVLVLSDEDEAHRAAAALVATGFASHDIKLYPGEQILATFEIYKGQRDLADKVVGVVTDDIEGRDLYLEYAREGRCGLWLRVDEYTVAKALRVLADYDYLHTRYYGVKTETDYHVSEPEIVGVRTSKIADIDETEIPSDVEGKANVAADPTSDVDESTTGSGAGEVVPVHGVGDQESASDPGAVDQGESTDLGEA